MKRNNFILPRWFLLKKKQRNQQKISVGKDVEKLKSSTTASWVVK
jgi:hypothetical protein